MKEYRFKMFSDEGHRRVSSVSVMAENWGEAYAQLSDDS